MQWTYHSIQLNGIYQYQVTAYNDFGSAATGVGKVPITVPGTTPTITSVTYLGSNNSFEVKGTGFTSGGEVLVIAQVGGYAAEERVAADWPDGTIKREILCIDTCKQAGRRSVAVYRDRSNHERHVQPGD